MAITDLASVKLQVGIKDASDDVWLAGVITAVGDAMEAITKRFLWPRSTTTYYFDGSDNPWRLEVPKGISALTYLGVAWLDQPADGSGTYTTVPLTYVYLDPNEQERAPGMPATAITIGSRVGIAFPLGGNHTIKATGDWGPDAVPTRAGQIAVNAITRAYRAKSSGGADYTIIGPEGGMKILRDFAPAETEELYGSFAVAGGYA